MYIINILGLFVFVLTLLDKFKSWDKIDSFLNRLSIKLNSKFLHELYKCDYCKKFWILLIVFLIDFTIRFFGFGDTLTLFVVYGIYNLIKQIK